MSKSFADTKDALIQFAHDLDPITKICKKCYRGKADLLRSGDLLCFERHADEGEFVRHIHEVEPDVVVIGVAPC